MDLESLRTSQNDSKLEIEKAWKLIKIFAKPYLNITDYRNYLIKKIPKKYTVEEFYICEKIIDKLFWDLRNKIKDIKDIKDINECNSISYLNSADLDDKLYKIVEEIGTYYRSFINKLIIVDKSNKKIYYKKMDGSSIIFEKPSNFNLLTLSILFDRKLYEEIMSKPINKKELKQIELPQYYYQLDYCFPNINCCQYNVGTDEERMERIRKIYYTGSSDYWYKLIV